MSTIPESEFFDETTGLRLRTPDGKPMPAWVREQLQQQRLHNAQRQQAALLALQAIERLCEVLQERSGQPYKLRALLWSLWNGKPASLIEIVHFDWPIRQDLLLVLAGFGYEDHKVSFFYQAIETAIRKAGQWDWFEEERKNIQPLKEWVESLERSE